MESVLCTGHDTHCYLKTGTKPGPNQGKSFYVCSHPKEKCQYVKPTGAEAKFCPQHTSEMIYLQAMQKGKITGEKSYYYRCKGRSLEDGAKSNWCGHFSLGEGTKSPLLTVSSQPTSDEPSTNTVKTNTEQHDTQSTKTDTISNSDRQIINNKDIEQHLTSTINITIPDKTNLAEDKTSFAELAQSSSKMVSMLPKPSTKLNDFVDASSNMSYREKVKESVAVIEVESSDDENDDLCLDEALRERRDLQIQLDKQKNVVRSVKMSCLPDKGKKLVQDIENIQKCISSLDLLIEKEIKKTNSSTVMSQVKQSQNQKQTVYIAQPGKPGSYQTMLIPQTGSNSSSSDQVMPTMKSEHPTTNQIMLAAKPGSNQTILVTQPPQPGSNHTVLLSQPAQLPAHVLAQMYAANPQAMTLYGGRMTAARLREVGSVTSEALERLHKQLECCPKPTDELEDPKGVKVNLMTHQRQALAWLAWRERENPAGGILADDMGLGKTLTSISLILKQRETRQKGTEEEKSTWLNRDKQLEKLGKSVIKSKATLIICPASLIHQWNKEIERRCNPGLLKVLLYHGPNRERDVLKLADYDIVLTTYNIVSIEVGIVKGESAEDAIKDEVDEKEEEMASSKKQPNILRIAWERIILDEAHNIKNFKSKTSMSVCKLRSGFRWALTGTPIQNDLLDMYSLLRFLRCTPFDEYKVWKRNVDNSKGTTRLNTIIRTLLLRRTKQQLNTEGKPLIPLPSKTVKTYHVELTTQERAVYDKVFAKTKTTVQNYVKRHEEKGSGDWKSQTKPSLVDEFSEKLTISSKDGNTVSSGSDGRADNKATGSQLLVLILRLRQCCCHLSLMKQQLEDDILESEGIGKDTIELTLEEQMQGLMLDSVKSEEKTQEDVKQELKSMLEVSHFSSKLKAVVEKIKLIRMENKPGDNIKSVIVSQWTKMLEVIGYHLTEMGIKFCTIQGNVPPKKRMEMVEDFNTNPHGSEVMLVSLRAGGVGLNLIGGSHLFVVDIHWNPALEEQACDRIFRVGQTRDVFIHKYICKDTIEEKIVELQKNKTKMASNVLSGSGATSQKLSMADLRMMFGV